MDNPTTIDDILFRFKVQKERTDSELKILCEKSEKLGAAREKLLEQGGLTIDEYVALAKMLAGEFPGGDRSDHGCNHGFKLHGERYDPKKSICDNCYGNNTGVSFENCGGFYNGYDEQTNQHFRGQPEFYKTTGKLIFEPTE